MIHVIDSRFATGAVVDDAVAARPVEGVDTHLLLAPGRLPRERHGSFRKGCPGRWHHGSLWTVIAPVDRVTTPLLRLLDHRARGRESPATSVGQLCGDVSVSTVCSEEVSRGDHLCSVVWSGYFESVSRAGL
jgi:hypothetical protein